MTMQQLKSRRRIVLVYLYCLFAAWGAFAALTVEPPKTESAMRLAGIAWVALAIGTSLGFMWFCTLDGKLVGKPIPQLARIGLFVGWPLGVPIYLLWARRLRGLLVLLLHGILLSLLSMATALILAYVYLGPEWYA